MAAKTLVLGGIRSGKSAFAEGLMATLAPPYLYIATAELHDDGMRQRVTQHQARRGGDWRLCEAPLDLPAAVRAARQPVLVDCLSMWVTNLLLAERPLEPAFAALVAALESNDQTIICVSNEVGLGGISANALQRRFADTLGLLNQRVAGMSDQVFFIAAGLPLKLKG